MDQLDAVDRAGDEVWYLDALGRELDADVRRDVYRFAVSACYRLHRRGVRVDPDLAKNLVADAISDTANGNRRCVISNAARCFMRSPPMRDIRPPFPGRTRG